jgi:hypothetical protein
MASANNSCQVRPGRGPALPEGPGFDSGFGRACDTAQQLARHVPVPVSTAREGHPLAADRGNQRGVEGRPSHHGQARSPRFEHALMGGVAEKLVRLCAGSALPRIFCAPRRATELREFLIAVCCMRQLEHGSIPARSTFGVVGQAPRSAEYFHQMDIVAAGTGDARWVP